MPDNYEHLTLGKLKEELWAKGLIPKRWMLNYVRKSEAIHLLTNVESPEAVPTNYVTIIKQRCSNHRKKVYQSRKNRQEGFGAALSKEEKLKKIANTADTLIFVELENHDSAFTSYLGSNKAKLAFVFKDQSGTLYKFTRTEIEKLASMGLYVPRGVLSSARTRIDKPAKSTKTLKDIFGD
jgi:hypothetical protein